MKIVSFVLLLISVFILTACPVSSSFPLGEKGSVPLDPKLLGTWISEEDPEDIEAKQITISKGKEKNTYSVHVDEPGEAFMANSSDFTGWLVELKTAKFLVLQELVEGMPAETYYVYHITINGNSIVTNDITLGVNGTEAITSISAYQEEVLASMELEDFLGSEINWSVK